MDSQDTFLPNSIQEVVPYWSILFIFAYSDWLLGYPDTVSYSFEQEFQNGVVVCMYMCTLVVLFDILLG